MDNVYLMWLTDEKFIFFFFKVFFETASLRKPYTRVLRHSREDGSFTKKTDSLHSLLKQKLSETKCWLSWSLSAKKIRASFTENWRRFRMMRNGSRKLVSACVSVVYRWNQDGTLSHILEQIHKFHIHLNLGVISWTFWQFKSPGGQCIALSNSPFDNQRFLWM